MNWRRASFARGTVASGSGTIACSRSLVLAELMFPKTAPTFDRRSPAASMASMVLAKVAGAVLLATASQAALAQGFDKINTTVTNVNTILVTISIAVVTIAIIWAGFKMIFQGARLADVANVLIGGTLVGGAAAFASFIVT